MPRAKIPYDALPASSHVPPAAVSVGLEREAAIGGRRLEPVVLAEVEGDRRGDAVGIDLDAAACDLVRTGSDERNRIEGQVEAAGLEAGRGRVIELVGRVRDVEANGEIELRESATLR